MFSTSSVILAKLVWSRWFGSITSSGDSQRVNSGLEIPDNEGDGFSVEPIGGVPNQSGPREGSGANDVGSGGHKKEVKKFTRKLYTFAF